MNVFRGSSVPGLYSRTGGIKLALRWISNARRKWKTSNVRCYRNNETSTYASVCMDEWIVYPDTTTALTASIFEFLSDNPDRDVVLQQGECSNEPRWPSANLMHRENAALGLSIAAPTSKTYHEYGCNRSRHSSGNFGVHNCCACYQHLSKLYATPQTRTRNAQVLAYVA